ncbi:hypothetical protein DB88DRAFT_436789 [Papiliotrema laurentii]|uniref:DUF952 domain-containing protein n=1 Tax=Papiliotrema laurentii TaxID=5418 RepID=A0AAD9FT21_PAPLA|nr:hypothetical protein DB88DRAFT_436789 [Papiliotrema laurentii]
MSQTPKWIYKIFPHSSVDPRYTFPIPIPASHTFFLSEVDYKDGFVHLSTAEQVPGTLDRFFGDVESVTLLRLELDRVAAFKRIRWEESSHGGKYPHLFAHLEGENVESFKDVRKGPGEKGWAEALAKPEIKEWLV